MTSIANTLKDSVIEYCARTGTDPMLVQGAGGNVSWKDGDSLWIKASGTWLADALHQDIFVPVDLAHLMVAIKSGDFSVTPKLRSESVLRPSIETLLHALMPHPVVVHLHAIEILAHLVRHNYEAYFTSRLDKQLRWTSVGYKKPGATLAAAVSVALDQIPGANVVFLKNHGVVIGASNVGEVENIQRKLVDALACIPHRSSLIGAVELLISPFMIVDGSQYFPVSDTAVHQLAIDVTLFDRLSKDWALYPDHVVFLGARPACFTSLDVFLKECGNTVARPELAFIQHVGVFSHHGFGLAKQAQLRCYYDVLTRQPEGCNVDSLNDEELSELLNWDAEHHRQQNTK